MNYGYIRVSTDRQTVENQRFEISKWCKAHNTQIDDWIEETISGTKNFTKRRLGILLEKISEQDFIICSELSRLGRNLFMIMEILNICMSKKCRLQTVKENFTLDNGIQSKVLAFAFGLSAEIERNLISQRTKEALAARKAEGKHLGRTKGRRGQLNKKCVSKIKEIDALLKTGIAKQKIARLVGVSAGTFYRFLVYTGRYSPKTRNSQKWKCGIYQ